MSIVRGQQVTWMIRDLYATVITGICPLLLLNAPSIPLPHEYYIEQTVLRGIKCNILIHLPSYHPRYRRAETRVLSRRAMMRLFMVLITIVAFLSSSVVAGGFSHSCYSESWSSSPRNGSNCCLIRRLRVVSFDVFARSMVRISWLTPPLHQTTTSTTESQMA